MDQDIKKEPTAEPDLISLERLDRNSPELWPEKMPGIENFKKKKSLSVQRNNTQPQQLTQEEIKMMFQLGSLSTAGLIAEIKKIFDEGYQLGNEETKEITRGKYLNILGNTYRKLR